MYTWCVRCNSSVVLEMAMRSGIPIAIAVSNMDEDSIGFVGLDSELDEDPMPLFLVLLLPELACSMAFGE